LKEGFGFWRLENEKSSLSEWEAEKYFTITMPLLHLMGKNATIFFEFLEKKVSHGSS
jgi:hypothetical protein